MKILTTTLLILSFSTLLFSQSSKSALYFSDPIVTDSTSTVMIPINYNSDLLSSNKLVLWNNFFANVLFYNFVTDSTTKLFKENTYIKGLNLNSSHYYNDKEDDFMSSNWVFYFVKQNDYNNSGKIDSEDPSILYVSDKFGNKLQALTPPNENAVSIKILDAQGIALIKMQRDMNNNKKFEYKDKSFYYLRLKLETLEFGKNIELE